MKYEVVVRLSLDNLKRRTKGMKLVAGFPGVQSISFNANDLHIVGEFDPVDLVRNLRKKIGLVDLVSVRHFEEKLKEEQKSKNQIDLGQTTSRVNESNVYGRDVETTYRVDESYGYGRDDDVKRVIELLLSDKCRERDIYTIHIIGGSGVGKTFFANILFNHCIVCDIFERRAWVSSNDRLDVRGLTKEIIESFAGISCDLTELTEIQEAVREELMGKRFFLVLDNVSNDQLNFWSSLLIPFSVGARGSIVLTTTQNEMGTHTVDMMSYKLNGLSKSSCWVVFGQHVFDKEDVIYHDELIKIGEQFITRCEGLPLSVKAIGGILRSEFDENSWEAILRNEQWDKEDLNLPLRALRLSYDHLPEHLKKCFFYCSLYPKGYIFEKHLLVRLWICQGFIEHEEGKHEEDIGNEYFDELLMRSYFEHSPNCAPTDKKYVMHDLFNDLAQSLPGNTCFRAETCKLSSVAENIHHVALVPYCFDTAIQFDAFKKPRDIHTLLLINRSYMKHDASIFHVENPAILNDLLFQLRCLRTLDLSFTNIEEVPESIANLRDLCFLALNKTNIRRLPESICSLYNLQTLELKDCDYLSELPACIKKLANLKHLDVWKKSGFIFMPYGIGQLTGLLTLPKFGIGGDEQHCGIRELRDLMNLRGSLCIGGLWNVINSEEAKEANLETKEHIRTLTLQWFNCGEDLKGYQSAETAFEVLNNLQPHSNIEKLTIRNYSGNHFPEWMANPSFSMLSLVTLENCYECNILPPLGVLPCLKYLSIQMMDGVQYVGNEFNGDRIGGGFPSLETLKLLEMFELEIWCEVTQEDFPSLCSLTISRCDRLKRLPRLNYLKELSVHSCAELPVLPTLPCLSSLKIEGVQNLETFPHQLHLPALEILEINNCNQIFSLGDLHHSAFLKKLKVTRCPKLKFLPNKMLPSNLEVVEIGRGCALLSDWCPYGFKEITSARQVTRKLVRKRQPAKHSFHNYSTDSCNIC